MINQRVLDLHFQQEESRSFEGISSTKFDMFIGFFQGYVVLTHPRNACTKVAPPPQIPTGRFPWIALIPRTKTNETCDFDLKVTIRIHFLPRLFFSSRFSMLRRRISVQLSFTTMKIFSSQWVHMEGVSDDRPSPIPRYLSYYFRYHHTIHINHSFRWKITHRRICI